MSVLMRAWVALIALSVATTAVALLDLATLMAGATILLIAWAKARLIFLHYLELADVPGWRGGLMFGLALFMALLFVLYASAGSGSAHGLGKIVGQVELRQNPVAGAL